jgi:hypothetical protein
MEVFQTVEEGETGPKSDNRGDWGSLQWWRDHEMLWPWREREEVNLTRDPESRASVFLESSGLRDQAMKQPTGSTAGRFQSICRLGLQMTKGLCPSSPCFLFTGSRWGSGPMKEFGGGIIEWLFTQL